MGQEDKAEEPPPASDNESESRKLLQKILLQADDKSAPVVIEQMLGKNGLLRPLAAMIEKLLEDPVLRQAMDSRKPLDGSRKDH